MSKLLQWINNKKPSKFLNHHYHLNTKKCLEMCKQSNLKDPLTLHQNYQLPNKTNYYSEILVIIHR